MDTNHGLKLRGDENTIIKALFIFQTDQTACVYINNYQHFSAHGRKSFTRS